MLHRVFLIASLSGALALPIAQALACHFGHSKGGMPHPSAHSYSPGATGPLVHPFGGGRGPGLRGPGSFSRMGLHTFHGVGPGPHRGPGGPGTGGSPQLLPRPGSSRGSFRPGPPRYPGLSPT